MQAMIYAAGRGERLKPITDLIPKALVPVGEKPLLQMVLDKLASAGVNHVVINVHHHAEQIKNFLLLARKAYDFEISVSDETGDLLETGGGIKKARRLFKNLKEPILIHNVDIIHNVDLKLFYERAQGNDATLLVSERKTNRYLLFDDDMRLVGWTNTDTGEVKSPYLEKGMPDGKPFKAENFKKYAFSGIHVFSPTLFLLMDLWPERFPIMDFYLKHCADRNIRGIVKQDLKLLDVGKIDTLAEARSFIDGISLENESHNAPNISRGGELFIS